MSDNGSHAFPGLPTEPDWTPDEELTIEGYVKFKEVYLDAAKKIHIQSQIYLRELESVGGEGTLKTELLNLFTQLKNASRAVLRDTVASEPLVEKVSQKNDPEMVALLEAVTALAFRQGFYSAAVHSITLNEVNLQKAEPFLRNLKKKPRGTGRPERRGRPAEADDSDLRKDVRAFVRDYVSKRGSKPTFDELWKYLVGKHHPDGNAQHRNVDRVDAEGEESRARGTVRNWLTNEIKSLETELS